MHVVTNYLITGHFTFIFDILTKMHGVDKFDPTTHGESWWKKDIRNSQWKEGGVEGWKEGRVEGRKEGKKKGRKEGRVEGIVIDRTMDIFGKTEPKTELIFGRTEYSKKTRIFSFLFCWNFTE